MTLSLLTSDGTSTVQNVKNVSFTENKIKIDYESDREHTIIFDVKDIKKLDFNDD